MKKVLFGAEKVELEAEGETIIGLGRGKFGTASGPPATRPVQIRSMHNGRTAGTVKPEISHRNMSAMPGKVSKYLTPKSHMVEMESDD